MLMIRETVNSLRDAPMEVGQTPGYSHLRRLKVHLRLYDGNPLPPSLEGFMKAGANIGAVIGQFAFGESTAPTPSTRSYETNEVLTSPSLNTGYLADALGRKAICKSTVHMLPNPNTTGHTTTHPFTPSPPTHSYPPGKCLTSHLQMGKN
jgi:hypothetical protein